MKSTGIPPSLLRSLSSVKSLHSRMLKCILYHKKANNHRSFRGLTHFQHRRALPEPPRTNGNGAPYNTFELLPFLVKVVKLTVKIRRHSFKQDDSKKE